MNTVFLIFTLISLLVYILFCACIQTGIDRIFYFMAFILSFVPILGFAFNVGIAICTPALMYGFNWKLKDNILTRILFNKSLQKQKQQEEKEK